MALVGLLQPGEVAAARQGDERGVREQSGELRHDEARIADTRHRKGGHTFVPCRASLGVQTCIGDSATDRLRR
jgi:hypothetical protein